MKKITIGLMSIFMVAIVANAQYLKELNLEDRLANSNPSDLDESLGFSSDREVPSFFSMEDYAIVSKQKGQSCTGFSISAAMTIMYNEANKITRYTEQLINRFDPFYIYCALKDVNNIDCVSGDGCKCGSYIYKGLELVENYGCKKWYLSPHFTCSSTITTAILRDMYFMTGLYTIDGYDDLLDYEKIDGKVYYDIDIDKIKYVLSAGLPVVGGITVGDRFADLQYPNVLYSAEKGEVGRHAITIVGYNDNYNGGSFRILNSYGSDWGDNGLFWMTYDDFVKKGDAAYVIWVVDNFDSWTAKTYEKADFYKGSLTNELNWEGTMDSEGNCHGRGILTGESFSAFAYYDHGKANGEWFWFSDEKDGFWGSVIYDDGTVVSREEWGFVVNQNPDAQINQLQTDNMDISISEVATEDDFIPTILLRINNNSSKKQSSKFNFNKTNNYNKKFNFNKTNK